jgi:SpoIID/LytB domain
VKSDGASTSRFSGPFLVRASSAGTFIMYEGKRYRGELVISQGDNGLLVVNRLGVESYLRGVVPLEIGDRKPGEEAAVQAQAVAARSYSYIHMQDAGNRGFDMYGSTQDQVYGGVDAEKPMSDDAVSSTHGMVVRYAGRIINTPYSSTCGEAPLLCRKSGGGNPISLICGPSAIAFRELTPTIAISRPGSNGPRRSRRMS